MNPSFQESLAKLPHGPGFRFVHQLIELEPGCRASAHYTVPATSEFLAGHFPGAPMMPGVLLLEAGAQLAGILAHADLNENTPAALKLAAVRQVKFPGTAFPGDQVVLEAVQVSRLGNLFQARIKASVAGRLVLEGEVVLGA